MNLKNTTINGHGFFRKSKAYGLVCALALGLAFLGNANVSAEETVTAVTEPMIVAPISNVTEPFAGVISTEPMLIDDGVGTATLGNGVEVPSDQDTTNNAPLPTDVVTTPAETPQTTVTEPTPSDVVTTTPAETPQTTVTEPTPSDVVTTTPAETPSTTTEPVVTPPTTTTTTTEPVVTPPTTTTTTTEPKDKPSDNGTKPTPMDNVATFDPFQSNTGHNIVGIGKGVVIVQNSDGTTSSVAPSEVGGTVEEDGSVIVPTSDGKMKRLPNTGEATSILSVIGGMNLLGIAGYLVRKKK